MNKAVSWTISRGGFDSREAARDAARRQGKSLGEWLHGVIADHATELGIEEREVVDQDRIDAVTSKLENMSTRSATRDDRREPGKRTTGLRSGDGRGEGRPGSRPARDVFGDTPGAEEVAPAPRSSTRPPIDESFETRRQRRNESMIEETEVLLEEAIGAMERRAMKAERRADDALTSFTKLLERNEARRERERDSVETLTKKLSELETRLTDRDQNPVKGALARLEARLEMIGRRSAAETGAWRSATVASADATASDREPIRRLEDKLNAVLEAVGGRPDPSTPHASSAATMTPTPEMPSRRRRFGDAITEIANRQRDLDDRDAAAAGHDDSERRDMQAPRRGASRFSSPPVSFVGMQEEIAALAAKIDDMRCEVRRNKPPSRAETTVDVDALRSAIAALAQQLRDLAPRGAVQALESQIANLATRIEVSRDRGTGEAILQPVEHVVDDLRRALGAIDPREIIESLESEVRAIGAKIDLLTRGGLDAGGAVRIQDQMQEIRDLIQTTAARPLAVEHIERQIVALAARLDRQMGRADLASDFRPVTDDIRASIANPQGAAAFQKIEDRLEDLAMKVDEAISLGSTRRPAEATSNGPDVTSLESLVRDLGDKIDAVRSPDADNSAIEALQQQISLLASRFERSETGLASLTTLQRSMQDLFAHLEETRALVETSAARAAREVLRIAIEGGKSESAGTPEHDLAVLKSIHDDADVRTRSALGAVHETLGKVSDRLSLMEGDIAAGTRPDLLSADQATPQSKAPMRQGGSPPSLSLDAADPLLDPMFGTKAKGRPKKAAAAIGRGKPTDADEGAGRADFIAAARRAAQAAQTDPSVLAAERPHIKGSAISARESLIEKSRDYVSTHKRPVLLGLAAVFAIVGTMAIVERLSFGTAPVEVAATPAPTKIAQVLPQTKPKNDVGSRDVGSSKPSRNAPPSAKLGPDSDPIQTGSIPSLPAFAAHGGVAPLPLPTLPAGLLAMGEKGDRAAAFTLGARYAEGRGVPHDFTLAAKWYAKAADRGLAPAQYRLASLYEKGLGVPQDKARAKGLYLEAANAGNPRAMHNLAVLLADGGGKPDYEGAAIWFRKAAEYGIHDSQFNLAILLARGLGVKPSLVQSYEWFAVAAQQNDGDAAKKRDEVGSRLDASDLAVAKALAANFHPRVTDHLATDVDPPTGGWDGASAKSPVNSARAKISSL